MLRDLTYKVIVIDDDPDLYEDYIEEIEGLFIRMCGIENRLKSA